MESAVSPGALQERAELVRTALRSRYAHPVVVVDVAAGVVRVPAGKALDLARESVGGGVEAVDYALLPWHAVPVGGVVLWRQHGRSGSDGEVVTQLLDADPPLQVVACDAGWSLVRCADGAQGWIELAPDQLAPAAAPDPDLADVGRVDVEGLVQAALEQLGAPYVWGGTGLDGVDCSGLVQRAAWQAGGCWLPRHSRALLRAGRRVAPAQLRRGDVLVLQRDPETYDDERRALLEAQAAEQARSGAVPAHGPAIHPMHVAIAVSAGEVVHASRDAMRVVREDLTAIRSRYRVLGVRRLGPGAGMEDA